MIILNVNDLSLSFGTKPILEEITFSMNEGDRLGIVGVNGCGKSTLFRMILGEQDPDEGNVYLSKNTSVGVLRQNDALSAFEGTDGEATALEVMFLSFPELLSMETRLSELESLLKNGSTERTSDSLAAEYTALNEKFLREGGLEFRSRCASTLLKMGFDEETMRRPFSTLSGGQRTRLALSRELCREPDLLLLDEPTNHLDMETLVWLEGFLANYKKTLIVISHDRYFLDRVTTRTLFIEHHRAKVYDGNYSKSAEKRKAEREIEERHYKNQQKEIARQEAYIAQQRAWNRERNIVAAESRQKMLDKMVKLERPKEAPKAIKIKFSAASASGNDVLTLKDISFGYGHTPLFSDLSCLVKRGDRLFVVGPNGCGKSTLVKLLLGKLEPQRGYLEAGYNVEIGYYDQENQNLSPSNTVLDEVWNAYPTMTELSIRNALARFRFIGEDVYLSVSELSGGERARLTLCKLILSEMNLLILDEPTNHLDIDSREALEEALSEFDGTIITVSHDRYLVDKLATRFLDFTPSGVRDFHVTRVGHAYEELLHERDRFATANDTATVSAPSTQKEQYLQNKKDAAEARKKQNRIERLEKEAEKIGTEIDRIDREMSEVATDYVKLSELDTEKNAFEERLIEIYEELEELGG